MFTTSRTRPPGQPPQSTRNFLRGVFCILALMLCNAAATHAQSNIGKFFYVVFLSSETRAECDDSLMLFITGPRKTTVDISVPGFKTQTYLVMPGSQTVVTVQCVQAGPVAIAQQSNVGIFLNAKDSIAVDVHIVAEEEGDAYGALPISRWGADYRVLSNNGSVRAAVLAAYDSTVVAITSNNGTQFDTVVLQRGQVEVLTETGEWQEMFVHASRPVAVIGSGVEHGENPARYADSSQLTEQYPPIPQWGTEFYSMPFDNLPDNLSPSPQNEFLHISASVDGTAVMIDGVKQLGLSAGNYAQIPETGFHHIVSNQPILVAQNRISSLEDVTADPNIGPRLAMVPAISQYQNDVYFVSSDFLATPEFRHYIDIVHPASTVGSLRLDGVALANQAWRQAGPAFGYVGLRLQVSRGPHHLHSTDPFAVIAFGTDSAYRTRVDFKRFDYDGYAYTPGSAGPDSTVKILSALTANFFANHCGGFTDTVIVLENNGYDTVHVDSVSFTGRDSVAFALLKNNFPIGVPPQQTATIHIRFTPRHNGISVANAILNSRDAINSPVAVQLNGTFDSIPFSIAPLNLNFGPVALCDTRTLYINIRNPNAHPIALADTNIFRPASPAFEIPKLYAIIQPGATYQLQITYHPTSTSPDIGVIRILDLCDTIAIPLYGYGYTPTLTVSGQDFGSLCLGDTLSGIIMIVNPCDTLIPVDGMALAFPFIVDSPSVPFVVKAHDSVAVYVTFAPQSNTTYNRNLELAIRPCHLLLYDTITGTGGAIVLSLGNENFGSVCLGDSTEQLIPLNNPSSATVTLTADSIAPPFRADPSQFPLVIPPHGKNFLRVMFAPPAGGNFSDTILLSGEPCNATVKATISGACGSVLLTAGSLDFGVLCPGDTAENYLYLRNPSSRTVTITTAAVNPPFTIDSPAVPFDIKPGDTLGLRIKFFPTASGKFNTSILFLGQPCGITCAAFIFGEREGAAVTSDDADFGAICVGRTATQSVALHNTGAQTATIDSISISSAIFKLLTPMPLTIAAGDSQQVEIAFTPNSTTPFTAALKLFSSPCGVSAQAQLRGVGDSVMFTATNYYAGKIRLGDSTRGIVTIQNTGTVALVIDSLALLDCASCAFSFSETLPIVLAPGEVHYVSITYFPSAIESDSAQLCIIANAPCPDTMFARLSGEGVSKIIPGVELCAAPKSTVVVGSILSMEVDMINELPAPPDSLKLDLVYDQTALQFLGTTGNGCPANVRIVAPGRVRFSVLPCGKLSVGEESIVIEAQFRAMATAQDTLTTTIAIDSVQYFPNDAIPSGCTSTVEIDPICGMSGVTLTSATSITGNYPNPFSNASTISISISPVDKQNASLKMFDVYGRLVAEYSNALRIISGTQGVVEINGTQLPSGVYECVLEAAGKRTVRQMQIVK